MKDFIAPPASRAAPDTWLDRAFSSTTALTGGIIKRTAEDVERNIGRERFLSEVRKRGFQALENGDSYVVFCNLNPVRLAVPRPALILR